MRRLLSYWKVFCALSLLAVIAGAGWWYSARGTPQLDVANRPKLVVLVVFDQMRGDYLVRWQELFGEGGFRRLQQEGTWFQNCHYPYAHTVTAAGHASILTGCSPNRHGIVGNEWYEREAGPVYCVGSDRYTMVPPRQAAGKRAAGDSPERLMAPTLGDALHIASDGKSKLVGISFKDRAAVLPAGHHPNVCLWIDGEGLACTSTFYADRLPAWATEFNAARPADRWFGKDWLRFRPDINYVRYSGIDDAEGEGTGFKQGRTFPHPMTGGLTAPGKEYYRVLYNSPFGNELVLDLAKRAIDGERLGAGEQPDLLTVSFSCNDSVGHTWGPDSQEVMDVTLRADAIVRELLAHLDARVGAGKYVLAMTADHGVCPLPEASKAAGRDAGRLSMAHLASEADAFLCGKYSPVGGTRRWFEDATFAPAFLINRGLLRDLKLDQNEVEDTLVRWFEAQPGVARAFTRRQLEGPCPPNEDPTYWKAHYPTRCGDITIVPKPYWIWAMPFQGGANHGTPYPYDTHVPLLVYGFGVPAGVRTDRVTPQATCAILARALGIAPPASCEAPLPTDLFVK